ncbi:uroporphyrinogen-III C-methyltransferase [Roseibacillus ishigakijimensis]|uniref:uroporphyrinogen-III C-methyltransferase n=1 Tax=Roseibacillus ishigakijimensis TaxID=454146 RepID=A0A934VI24_9BACT|nr:uroporphyrinogen-III C-methyltransferase [Roseibacillus ishigakijimensis]MBK1834618.1 uroporphyrinogen-III C-methyltransferase [Roseibacillus ishigakijimensis]
MKSQGICYLVGAGPGDIGLITVKGRECVESCDVLVYDALSSPELLTWTKPGCEKIYAGKRAKNHAIPQEGINALIVEKTLAGKTVCRLKGGDPMIFGRGGEEAAELAAAGVPFEIVPGISSTIGGPAYAGIPVTHRDHCSQLTLFTGHEDPTKEETSLDYAHLAKTPGTKVFVMGISRLREITAQFVAHGAAPDTPIALTRWATTGKHRTITGTLVDIADTAERVNFQSPAVAVIGDVVKERERINWFESKPLFGKKVVVTRTREQAGKLSKELHQRGAEVLELPTIRIEDPDDTRGFAEAVRDAHTYDWLVFTSPNGVERFFEGFYAIYQDARSLGGPKIAAIGPATVAKVKEYRFTVDLVPEKHVAEGLLEAFKNEFVDSLTVLWVKADETRMVIADGLNALNAIVDICVAYKTVPESDDPTGARALLADEGADYITFTSGSTAQHFFALGIDLPPHCRLASIGPITTQVLTSLGHPPHLEAKSHDIPGLVAAIEEDAQSQQETAAS